MKVIKRNPPENIPPKFLGWVRFNEWANDNGIGEREEDWGIWWDCWKRGMAIAVVIWAE